MTEQDTAAPPQKAEAQAPAREALFAHLEELTSEEGHFEPVGKRHWALFEDKGPQLLVSFETLATLEAGGDALSPAHAVARAHGWSHLCLISDGVTWFRDPAVYRHFDRLVDDAFFEDFDQVLFYGHGSGGHAACAFAVAAPGTQVLALNPRATQGSDTVWDRRTPAALRLDFTSRYGYAPEMLEGAGNVVVIHDRTAREDAMHASLFRGDWITRLSMPLMGDRIEWGLRHMGLLQPVIELAMAGKLTTESFAKLWRKRRDFGPYLKALADYAETRRRKGLAIKVCTSVIARLRAPHFAKRLARLTAKD